MLNQALRRTSGSNVHTIHSMSWLVGPPSLVHLHRPSEPGTSCAREQTGDVAVQRGPALVASQDPDRRAEHPLAVAARLVGGAHVAARVRDGHQDLDRDELGHRPPHLLEHLAELDHLVGGVERCGSRCCRAGGDGSESVGGSSAPLMSIVLMSARESRTCHVRHGRRCAPPAPRESPARRRRRTRSDTCRRS